MPILSRVPEALLKCQSEIGWGQKWKCNLTEQFSADATHFRSEFKMCILILILTAFPFILFVFLSYSIALRWVNGWGVGGCLCGFCESSKLSVMVIHWTDKVVSVIKDINGPGMPLHNIITDHVLIWLEGQFHLPESVLPQHHLLLPFFQFPHLWIHLLFFNL